MGCKVPLVGGLQQSLCSPPTGCGACGRSAAGIEPDIRFAPLQLSLERIQWHGDDGACRVAAAVQYHPGFFVLGVLGSQYTIDATVLSGIAGRWPRIVGLDSALSCVVHSLSALTLLTTKTRGTGI
jgi:hypothetical protein